MPEHPHIERNPLEFFTPHSFCSHCLQPLTVFLPCLPLYSRDVVEEIVPISHTALSGLLQHTSFSRRYVRDSDKRRHRMFSAQEIKYIRGRHLIFNESDGTRRAADPEGL